MKIFRSGSISDEFAKSVSRNLFRKVKMSAYTPEGLPKWPNEKGQWPNPGQYTYFSSGEAGRNEILGDEVNSHTEHVFKNFPFRGKMYDLYVVWKDTFEEKHDWENAPSPEKGRRVSEYSLFDPEIMTASEYWTNAPTGGIKDITEFEKQKKLDPNSPGVKAWQNWDERGERALKELEDLEKTITPTEKQEILNFIKQNDPALPALKRANERRYHEGQEAGRGGDDYDPDDSQDLGADDAREWAGMGPLSGHGGTGGAFGPGEFY